MPAAINLAFDLGEDWFVSLSCKDFSGAALDLTGAAAELVVGSFAAPAATVVGNIQTPATDGVVQFTLLPAGQSAIRSGVYPYTARITLADGSVTDQAIGKVAVRRA